MKNISTSAATQLYEIYLLLPVESKEKIPNEIISIIDEKRAVGKELTIKNPNLINNAEILAETKKYLTFIFLKYLAEDDERKSLEKVLNLNEERYQNNLRKKYNTLNLFDNTNKSPSEVGEEFYKEKNQMIIKKSNWFIRLLNLFGLKK